MYGIYNKFSLHYVILNFYILNYGHALTWKLSFFQFKCKLDIISFNQSTFECDCQSSSYELEIKVTFVCYVKKAQAMFLFT